MTKTTGKPLATPHSPHADYSAVESLPQIWAIAADRFGEITALHNPHAQPEVTLSYSELYQQIHQFACGLQALGIQPQAKVALFADNSPRWLIADQGIMTAGAVDVVRSAGADREELLYILSHSDSTSLVVEDVKTLKNLRLQDVPLQLIILLSDEEPHLDIQTKILNFKQLLAAGENSLQAVEQHRETLATLMYTSGTTGKPKGVMLTHGNLLHQVKALGTIVQPNPGDRVLSILPSWHAYERSCEYFLLGQGCTQIYTTIRALKKDLQQFQPHYMVGVPRLWESIYEGVQNQFREQSPSQQRLINFFLDASERYIHARRIAQDLSLEHLDARKRDRAIAQAKATALQPLHALAEQIVYKKVRSAVGGRVKALISGGGSLARHIDDFF